MRYLEDAVYKSACANGVGEENGVGFTNPLARTVSGRSDGRQPTDADFATGGVVTPCAVGVEAHFFHLDALGGKACGVVGGGRDYSHKTAVYHEVVYLFIGGICIVEDIA